MTTSSSMFGREPGVATLARISTEFEAIARQMSTVSAEFAELRRIVENPAAQTGQQSAEQAQASPLIPPTVASAPTPPAPTPPMTTPPMTTPMAQQPPTAWSSPGRPPNYGSFSFGPPARPVPRPGPHPAYAPVAQPPSAPRPPRPPARPLSERVAAAAERGLVGKVLATAGVGVTLIGIALLLVLAAQAGILRPEFRVAGGAMFAVALVSTAIWLRRKPGGRAGAIATAVTGIAAGYLDVLAATKIYEWLPVVAGLAVAGAVAAGGLVLAYRWRSEHLGLLVVVPLIVLGPVLTGGLDMTLIAFMIVLAAASAWVQWRRDWIWLHTVRLAAPTIPLTVVGLSALGGTNTAHTGFQFAGATLVVIGLGFAGALVAMPTTRFRAVLAGLASATTVPVLLAGEVMDTAGAVALQAAVAVLVIGITVICSVVRTERLGPLPDVVAQIWTATSLVVLFVAILVCFDGPVAVSAMLGLATVTALVARSWSATSLVLLGGSTVIWGIGFAALLDDMPPYVLAQARLVEENASLSIVIGSLLAGAGAIVIAVGWTRLTAGDLARVAYSAAAVVVVYAVTAISVVSGVLIAGPDGFLGGHVVATTCWVVLAGATLAFARRRTGGERTAALTGGLVLVAAAMAKLFLFDLAALDGIFRVLVFIVTGLILLGLGAWYARALHGERVPGSSTTPPGTGTPVRPS
ncbi:DUF2339 domain-containing protein [Gordonia amicalis]|uniref:DUF2339 domain-containing protein n=1 Tax=Gordonia amicalis TaxID=89053 RepID=A0AAE4R5F1_9ACTN|nr:MULTISPECIES: DUF2339 domain-containing protein [Gordonia]MDV6308455.1 DUF2339 domain-containing protein [Gordonia amicalis]MDV6313449.1 DUF2339 domain-containing protein [Gordonia amicalis]MDV7100872.1 DUF2339 domain-containing protein [Gordonia amicalis]UPW15468.1 DUF2339 domain-containing protein [Gordonia amicalis]